MRFVLASLMMLGLVACSEPDNSGFVDAEDYEQKAAKDNDHDHDHDGDGEPDHDAEDHNHDHD
ncbi:MAG: hypothetical protein AAF291_04225 [Pseudomonadota bacterium]